MIDFYASEPHFAAQLAPIHNALPAEWRGLFGVAPGLTAGRARDWGVETIEGIPPGQTPIVIASYGDLKRVRAGAPRPIIYSEHGAGQQYLSSGYSNYIGGQDRAGVAACLVPGPIAFQAHRIAYPSLPAFQIGCPRLDGLTRDPASSTPALAFHWNGQIPETRSAFSHYQRQLAALPERFGRVIGHSHPKIIARHAPLYVAARLDVAWRIEDVFSTVGVLAVDNSSVMWEAALLGIPLVVLNCPSYRRDVEHGMRFWTFADIGPQVDRADHLADAIAEGLADTPERAEYRAEVAAQVYSHPAGQAAAAAADAVLEVAESLGSRPSDGEGRSIEPMSRSRWRRQPVNPYAPKKMRPRSEVLAERRGATPADVPTGSVAEVVAWIGDNAARAKAAVAAENKRAKPRVGVLRAAEAVGGG